MTIETIQIGVVLVVYRTVFFWFVVASGIGVTRTKLYCTNLAIPERLQREEREVSEWRRRVEEGVRLAREEASRSDRLLAQAEKTLNDRWTLELQNTEVGCCLPQFAPLVKYGLVGTVMPSCAFRRSQYLL